MNSSVLESSLFHINVATAVLNNELGSFFRDLSLQVF